MYLRKTTTAPNRGADVLAVLYEQLLSTHPNCKSIDVLHVGAGVGIKALANHTNSSRLARRLDSLFRSFPLPIKCFASYEPMELYDVFSNYGFKTRLKVADINPNVLSVVHSQRTHQQMSFELIDICDISQGFLTESFDVCIILNVFPHIAGPDKKQRAIQNLMSLTKKGGYILGVPIRECLDNFLLPVESLTEVDRLLYRKIGSR